MLLLPGKMFSAAGTIIATAVAIAVLLFGTAHVFAGPHLFSDVTTAAGISWKHSSGESEDRFLVEAMGGGVAFIDMDGDGLLDIFFVNGGDTPNGRSPLPPRNALYRNLAGGRFKDVAVEAHVDTVPFYGMGVAVADYDNDGRQDLYVTGYPGSALFHNNGDGTFKNVTASAGVGNAGRWGASAAWIDYDRDGRLDLFVCNYARFSFQDRRRCPYAGRNTYCAQTTYEGDRPSLFHNNGDGTFADVTDAAGLGRLVGRALGVVTIDIDDDGWPDLLVARDASPNLLLINHRNGRFDDAALDAEIAFTADGTAKAGMGVDAGDVNGDGRPDIVITNFNDESHSLFLNPGRYPYQDRTVESGLSGFTRLFVGWGAHFLDFDNDGALDLLLMNGHLNDTVEQARRNVSYREPPLLLANNGEARFRNMQAVAGPVFSTNYVARGLAVGDFDNDGRLDAVFTVLNDRPVLLHNEASPENAWLGIELEGTTSNRDAIGAKVTLNVGGKQMTRWVTSGSSYCSSHDRRIVFGLGARTLQPAYVAEVRWPNGQTQKVSGLTPMRYQVIKERLSAKP